MYKGDKPDSEEYLLGKKIDRHIDKSLVSKEATNSAGTYRLKHLFYC